MSITLPPPGQTTRILAKRVLVLAPHADDECMGCGGLLAQLAAAGAAIHVLYLSDSGGGAELRDDSGSYADRRRQEAASALATLGVASHSSLELPDGTLAQELEALEEGIRSALEEHRPDLVLVVSPLEASSDHRAAFAALHAVLSPLREEDPLRHTLGTSLILVYEVNHPFYPDVLVDVSEQMHTLEAALSEHRSQLELHNYLDAAVGVRRFRTLSLPPAVKAAEGFRRLLLEDFTTRSLSGLIRHLGGVPQLHELSKGPLVSVVVRTKNRPELLGEALRSLAASSYRRLEVVLVNDGGTPPELPADFPFPVHLLNHPQCRGRAAAANSGVAAATGEYVAFLDDDDLVEPEHFATLAGLVAAEGVHVVYSDAAVGVYRLAPEGGWVQKERRLPYSRDFDPELLLFDNYIPFNTLLIERGLFAEAGPFDEDLEFFEDWEFLIRLARVSPFRHHRQVSCEYRHFEGAGHHVLGDRPHERPDFLNQKAKVIDRFAEHHSAATLARVVDTLRGEAVAGRERAAAAERERERQRDLLTAAEDRYHRTNGELASVKAHRARLSDELDQSAAELQREREAHRASVHRANDELAQRGELELELRAKVEEQEGHLAQLYAEIERLNALLEAMRSTRAWRIHQQIEKLRGR